MQTLKIRQHLVALIGILAFAFLALGSNTMPFYPSPGMSLQDAQRNASQSVALGLVYYDKMPGVPEISRYITELQRQDLKNKRIRQSQLYFYYFRNNRMLSQQEVMQIEGQLKADQGVAYERRRQELEQEQQRRTEEAFRKYEQSQAQERAKAEAMQRTKTKVETGARKAQQVNPAALQQPAPLPQSTSSGKKSDPSNSPLPQQTQNTLNQINQINTPKNPLLVPGQTK